MAAGAGRSRRRPLVTVLGVLVWRIGDGARGYTRDASASAFVVLYLPLLAGFAVLLARPDDGAARVIVFIATVVCSDTGGYATGVLFGSIRWPRSCRGPRHGRASPAR